jgi:riboflavin kinase/FMN adenylyltransferase
MRVLNGMDGLRALPAGAVVSIGNFDGVHRGHAEILRHARSLDSEKVGVAVVTFEPHPLTVLRPTEVPPRLTPVEYKRRLLAEAGAAFIVELAPTPEVLGLSAERFWEILRDEVRPRHLVEGQTFTFGKGRGGTIDRLLEWTRGSSVELHIVDPVRVALTDLQTVPVSSSLVRWLVGNGRVRDVAICMGRPFSLEGLVVEGFRRGRTIGVPTANLRIEDQLVPMEGVYAGRTEVDGKTYPAAVSIGHLPTFGSGVFQIEAHLIGFEGDLYGRRLRLEFVDWVRDQQKFPGVEALKAQLRQDIRAAEDLARRRDAGLAVVTM